MYALNKTTAFHLLLNAVSSGHREPVDNYRCGGTFDGCCPLSYLKLCFLKLFRVIGVCHAFAKHYIVGKQNMLHTSSLRRCTGMWLLSELSPPHLSTPSRKLFACHIVFAGITAWACNSDIACKAIKRFLKEGVGLVSVSPRSLWCHIWTNAFLGFSSGASSGPSVSAPGSPASACALTDSAWT